MAYIDREKVCEMCNNKGFCCEKEKCPVYKAPTADVVEVKHGYWKFINQATNYLEAPYGDTCHCSVCGFPIDVSEIHFKRCPDCGAKMDGGSDENDV